MPQTFTSLDVTRRQGLFEVRTYSGTRYFIEARRRSDGSVRVISDGEILRAVYEGVVGQTGAGEPLPPTIIVGERLHIGLGGCPIVGTSKVVSITRLAASFESLVCSQCRDGYKEKDRPCALCHFDGD